MGMYLGGQKISPIIKVGEINNQDKTITENGTYTADTGYTGLGEVTVNVSSGDSGGAYLVQVLDYDGSVIKQDHLNAGDTFTLPNTPIHSGLVFQEWSSPVIITNNTVTITNSDITIGAIYTTASGLSEFDITLTTATGLSITLKMDGTKNWGDGTTDTETTHTYASTGDYTITCNGTTLTSSSSSGLFGQSTSYTRGYDGARNNAPYLKRVRLANSISIIPTHAFVGCFSLEYITIPKGVTSIGDTGTRTFASTSIPIAILPSTITSICSRAFECCKLENIIIPYGVVLSNDYIFNYATSLKKIYLYDATDTGFSGLLSYCISLEKVTIPIVTTATDLGSYGNTFQNCLSLKYVYIPSSITAIKQYDFINCFSLIEYDFSDHTIVPTLQNTSNIFNGINKIAKIKVPESLEAEWKSATNWATYADYIVGV